MALEYKIIRVIRLNMIIEKTMVLLKERKTTLVSAAVTGKIDVRNFNEEK